MILPITKYGNPILRQKGARIETVTPEIEKLVQDMFETMYAAAGVGLAAQQIGQALQLTIIDVRGVKDRPSTLELDGKAADVKAYMPVVLINPEIKPFGNAVTGAEGCLSFPEMYADVTRKESVDVTATNLKGERFSFRAGGLLARAVQHEFDHLNGILFIDRMNSETKAELKAELDVLQAATKEAMKRKGNP